MEAGDLPPRFGIRDVGDVDWPLECLGSQTAQFIFLVLMTPLLVLLN